MHLKKLISRHVVTLPPDASIVDAAQIMRDRHVGSVVVMNAEQRAIGIITDRDIVVGVVAKPPADLSRITLGEVCTSAPIVALEEEDLDAVVARMRRHGVRRIPVVAKYGSLVGVFSLDDAIGAIAEELANVAELLHVEQNNEGRRHPSVGRG